MLKWFGSVLLSDDSEMLKFLEILKYLDVLTFLETLGFMDVLTFLEIAKGLMDIRLWLIPRSNKSADYD